ncbi:histidine kinase [Maribacter sp. HTCC2170]|uniref:tetratricopeptide repeat-containing sensor histidine kinase n=1 Tax=Maribacter sp. (strain HTCC2170 / KCCM 42371) TaxID=313603 RepID=UPI00006BD501|nr:histidine kinase [Maribacter sp. HTCC2170]EAR02194.1 Histidine kinase [Maribacter sp. HTCC2170]
MQDIFNIFFFVLLGTLMTFSQINDGSHKFRIKGKVLGKEKRTPISQVEISSSSGEYTLTDSLGEFKILTAIGEELVIESHEFITVRYRVRSKEDIEVLVEDFSEQEYKSSKSKSIRKEVSFHKQYLDSANFYKKDNIEKSIDFIAKSIAQLGKRGNNTELSKSLTMLGEVYEYHQQYDLAITNFLDALEARKSSRTTLLLGKAYLLNKDYQNAERTLKPIVRVKSIVPYQRVEVHEFLGDSYLGLSNFDEAVAFYEEGLKIAEKNQVTPKITDLNSKIADAYAKGNRSIEAEGYYTNSLQLAESQSPQRSIQEKNKVADFYNKESNYDKEIQLRKQSVDELLELPSDSKKDNSPVSSDSITSQRINYKIANAYIAQDNFEEAIPYLQKSIVEADSDDDLIVQKDATRKLSEVYERKGEFNKALETYQEYVAVVDTLYVRKEQEISRAARFNREIASKQSRISGLEQERELSQSKYDLALTSQQLVIENNKRQKWVIYSLIFGLLLTALAAFFFYRSNQQQKLANNLLALKSLRSQMNPHFIFNALNSVNNYIAKSDERSANRYLSEFSTLMRAVLENSEEDFIPLSKELELLRLYVKLEHSRFPDKFDYNINIDETIDVDSYQIPPMLLQPYIENAIWHGLRYKEEKGHLNINIEYQDKNSIKISIEDDGIGREKSAALKTQNQKKQKSKGMGNISKRISILNDMYKDKVDVHISDLSEDGKGTRVLFTLNKDQ